MHSQKVLSKWCKNLIRCLEGTASLNVKNVWLSRLTKYRTREHMTLSLINHNGICQTEGKKKTEEV